MKNNKSRPQFTNVSTHLEAYLKKYPFYQFPKWIIPSTDAIVLEDIEDVDKNTEGDQTIEQTRRGLIEGVKEVLQYGQTCEKSSPKETDIPTPPPRSRTSSAEKNPKQKEESIVMRVVQETMIEKQEFKEKTDACNEKAVPTVTSPRLSSERDEVVGCRFVKFITEYARQDIRYVWTGPTSYSFDLHMERVLPADSSHLQGLSSSWTNKQDEALIKLANNIASKFNISPLKICPNEIYLTEAELASEEFKLLQGISI